MQPVTQEELERIIKEAKNEGKNVSDLEKELESMKSSREAAPAPPSGQTLKKPTDKGTSVIESTGPAREDDF